MSWQTKRSMSPTQYVWVLRRLKLSKAGAARFLGISTRTSSRYSVGKADIDTATALLLWSMVEHDEAPLVPKWTKP